MDTPFGLLVVVFLSVLSLSTYFMVVWALLPGFTAEVEHILHTAPGRSLWIGVANFLFLGSAIAVCGAILDSGVQIIGIPLVILLAIFFGLLSVGLTAFGHKIGRMLFAERSSTEQLGLGSITLILACLFPFVGWFLLLPAVGLLALGATFMNTLASLQPPSKPASDLLGGSNGESVD